MWCTRELPDGKIGSLFVEQANVGEGAAGIDADAKGGHGCESFSVVGES